MNSWISTLLFAWLPPFRIFINGMGRLYFSPSPSLKSLNKGIFLAMALQCAVANDTPKIAFAPKFFLFSVPSISSNLLSICFWFSILRPIISFFIILLIFFTAFNTPFPLYLATSLSLNSNASLVPVDAPEGTIALPDLFPSI